MSNRSALMLMVSSIGVALALASCSSDDEIVEGVGGSEAGSSGRSTSVGGSTPKGTASGGTTVSIGGSGGAVTTASAGIAGTAPVVTGGATGVGGSQSTTAAGAGTTAAGATGLAGAGGSGGVAGGNAAAGTAGVATTDVNTLCNQQCAIQSGVKDSASADCSLGATCMTHCLAPTTDEELDAGARAAYLAMLQCEVANLTAADYVCSTTAPVPATGMRGPAPYVNGAKTTPCATQICAFNCDEAAMMIYGDETVVTPCACP